MLVEALRGSPLYSTSIGSSPIDSDFVRLLPRADADTPLLLCTKSDFKGGVSSHYFHAMDMKTKEHQSLCWTPNEGSISGVGSSRDFTRVFVAVTDPKDGETLLFDLPVAATSKETTGQATNVRLKGPHNR
jgi:hypothetical protein